MLRTFAKYAAATAVAGLLSSTALAQVVYNRGNDTDPVSLDQHKTSTVAESNLLRDLYEGLVVYDAAANVIPGVAESWEVSDDGLVYTFKLRADAKWSNGDPVTANDFVFAFRRIQDPATAAGYANILFPIKNAEAINSGEMKPEELGARAIDDQTLEVTLENPTPYFIELLTHQTGLPLHQASVEALGDQFTEPGKLVSNGAYVLQSFTPNDQIVMVKNEQFYDAANVQIDQINYIPFEERATCLRRFEAGEVHSCSDIPVEQMDHMKATLGDKLRIAPYLGTYYLPVKVTKEKFADPRVRQALSMAIDRQFLADEIWKGSMVPAFSLVPPAINNYGDPVLPDWSGAEMLDREDQARALLAEAGVEEGELQIELLHNTGENHKNTMIALADMFSNIGVTATIREMEGSGYFDYMKNDGDFDISRAGWIGDFNDPQNFLFLLESDNLGFNYPRWANDEYDRLMQEAETMTDLEVRAQVLRQAEEIIIAEQPLMPILFYTSKSLVSDKLSGWEDNIQNAHGTRFLSLAE